MPALAYPRWVLALLPPEQVRGVLAGSFSLPTPHHVTVKAQGGLTPDGKWRAAVVRALAAFGEFELVLTAPAAFGAEVLYLGVASDRLHELHRALVAAVSPSAAEIATHFELDRWVPHLTLVEGPGAVNDEARRRAAALPTFAPIKVKSVWVLRQGRAGDPYLPVEALPLG